MSMILPIKVQNDLNRCNIMKLAEKLINCGSYIVLFLDEYYMPEHLAYVKSHFVHAFAVPLKP